MRSRPALRGGPARAYARGAMAAGLLLAACGGGTSTGQDPPGEPVQLWLSAARIPPGDLDVAAILVNRTGVDATFGVAGVLDRWDGDRWVPHRQVSTCLHGWFCRGQLRPLGEAEVTPAIGLVPTVGRPGPLQRFPTGGLDPGRYRVSQRSNEGVVAAGVFEVVGGAPAPAPLVPTDGPALSVTPALVPGGGRTVSVLPLVPAPGGRPQSLGDVEAATAGAAETATIERWDAGRWTAAGRAALRAGDSAVTRQADIPALASGAYRLVRAGPGGAQVGSFWVDGSIP